MMRNLAVLDVAVAVVVIGLNAWPFQVEPARLVPSPAVDVLRGSSTTRSPCSPAAASGACRASISTSRV